ncbi:MAG: D-alanyl-D-alanine carboxypeptidase [bacterium]|nr:D-alanyl-D-alanine carboxypeptidase [bacterium]
MRTYYSYRPPRISRADYIQKSNRSSLSSYIFSFGVIALGIGVGLSTLHQPDLLNASVLNSTEDERVLSARIKASDTLLTHVIPFLKTSATHWKLQDQRPQQAIGGGPGLLKDALSVKAALSINMDTGEVYYANNSAKRLPMASTTKIMTAMVAMDLASMDEEFAVETPATEVEPTIIGVKAGEKLSTRELIQGGLLTSGNDAMAVLAESIGKKYGGNTNLFVKAMNEKAAFLGLKNTHFTNPQGYDNPEHYSTCEDLAVMARYAMTHYPELSGIVSKREAYLEASSTHAGFRLPNWNMLINTYPGANGVKIGNTGDAGHTTIASATRDGKQVVAVVLGADGILKRDLSAAELLNVGFQALGIAPFTMTEDILRTRIKDWYP